VVAAFGDYAFDAAVYDEHGAGAAGGHAAVEGGAVDRDASSGGLAKMGSVPLCVRRYRN